MRTINFRRATVVLALAGLLPVATTGCFGKFQLIRKTYQFNKDIDPDKWVQWFAFLVMSIIPIYGIAALIDLVFANSVEFWTGENPITADTTQTVYGENGEVATTTFHPDGTADLVITDAQGRVHSLTLVREAQSVAARDAEGRLLARVGDLDGQPALID
jgi:hypothetical protein